MAKQVKKFRADNTYMISTDRQDNPKLGAKVLTDGKESLFLDVYFGAKKNDSGKVKIDRQREYLHLYLYPNIKTPIQKKQDDETLLLAKKIRFERGQQLLEDKEGYRLQSANKDINFISFFRDYYDSYTKKNKRVVKVALTRFLDFLRDTPEYTKYRDYIRPQQITREMVEDYADYLQSRSKGKGANVIFGCFKQVVNYGLEHDVFKKDPCKGVIIRFDKMQLSKEYFSENEIQQLISFEPSKRMNPDIRRAFILSLMCGIRFCDVKDLTFENVDYSNKILKFEQNKTKGHSANSGVVIPLTDDVLNLIGVPQHDKTERIFAKLPSYQACHNALENWVKAAGIKKHITWHCARHTFATIIVKNGTDVKTTASLLGHSSIMYVQRYAHLVDEMKRKAVASLPSFTI